MITPTGRRQLLFFSGNSERKHLPILEENTLGQIGQKIMKLTRTFSNHCRRSFSPLTNSLTLSKTIAKLGMNLFYSWKMLLCKMIWSPISRSISIFRVTMLPFYYRMFGTVICVKSIISQELSFTTIGATTTRFSNVVV